MSPFGPTRTIVLTGVSRGCGRALVDRFVAAGHSVSGCARSLDAIEELRRSFPAPHRFDVVDVSRPEDVRIWAAEVVETRGAPDLVINNAGLINPHEALWNLSSDEFARVIDVNVKGTGFVCQSFLPAMIDAGRGVLVNFSSGWGRSTSPRVAPYCASKWAIEGLTKALAQELPSGLAAVAVNPGIIRTEMLETCWGGGASSYPGPEQWSERAAPFLLGLGANDSGRSLSIA